jgi:hypothetical protein
MGLHGLLQEELYLLVANLPLIKTLVKNEGVMNRIGTSRSFFGVHSRVVPFSHWLIASSCVSTL